MVHCITYDGKGCGFYRRYNFCDDDLLENSMTISTGFGINEGMTQYMTQIRDAKYNKKFVNNGYSVSVEQVKNIMELMEENEVVDKDEFINRFLNYPTQLIGYLDLNFDIIDKLQSLDIVWKNEKEFYIGENERLLRAIFGMKKDFPPELKEAINNILYFYSDMLLEQEVGNEDDLVSIIKKMKSYSDQLDTIIPLDILDNVIQTAEENCLDLDEIVEKADIRQLRDYSYVNEFCNKDTNEKLKYIMNVGPALYIDYEDYVTKMMSSLYYDLDTIDGEWIRDFGNGLAEVILEKGYDFNKVQIEKYQVGDDSLFGYNLYNLFYCDANGKKKEYLDTTLYDFDNDDDDNAMKELEKVDEVCKKQIEEEYPQIKSIGENVTLLKNGDYIVVMGEDLATEAIIVDGEYTEIDESELKTLKSASEMFKTKIDDREKRMKELIDLNLPCLLQSGYYDYLEFLKKLPKSISGEKIEEIQLKYDEIQEEILRESDNYDEFIERLAKQKVEARENNEKAEELANDYKEQIPEEDNKEGQTQADN